MSRKQFEAFYWTGLKKAPLRNIELGFIPVLACQGKWDDRIEYLLEVPKTKAVACFYRGDIFRTQEVSGKYICIKGGLQTVF